VKEYKYVQNVTVLPEKHWMRFSPMANGRRYYGPYYLQIFEAPARVSTASRTLVKQLKYEVRVRVVVSSLGSGEISRMIGLKILRKNLIAVRLYYCIYITLINVFKGLRIEYAKSDARVKRWEEEMCLITEEMRRTLTFLEYKSTWWKNLQITESVDDSIKAGSLAYLERQSELFKCLHTHFRKLWAPTLELYRISHPWMSTGLSEPSSREYDQEPEDSDGENVEYDVE
jgi:hypothetical protein